MKKIRGIFCHDLPLYKDINGVYCSTTMTDALFRRYFHVVDELVVATRVYPIDTTWQEAHQEPITLPNIRFLDFPNLNTLKGLFFLIPKARKQLYEEAKDIDLFFLRGGVLAYLGSSAAQRRKKPYLVESSGSAWDSFWNYSLAGKIVAPYMELRERRFTRDASFVIYVTEKWLQRVYPTKGVSTYASNVILEDLDETALSRRLEKIAEKKKGEPIVLGTTGGIANKAKGQQFVMEAMKRLSDRYDFRYELVGGGDPAYLAQTAKKFGVEDRVVFKGQLNHEEVLAWLDTVDLYLQPSMQEGLPRALVEAMSRGCPAVGSTTAGIPELLPEECVFRRGKVRDLVRVLDSVLQSDLSEKAKINFSKAGEYRLDLLDARREKIYEAYRDYVVEGGKRN